MIKCALESDTLRRLTRLLPNRWQEYLALRFWRVLERRSERLAMWWMRRGPFRLFKPKASPEAMAWARREINAHPEWREL